MRITDGMDKTFGMYCGNKTGQSLLVTGDQVEIIFHSDGNSEKGGFLLVFTLVSRGKWDQKEVEKLYTHFSLSRNSKEQKSVEIKEIGDTAQNSISYFVHW